MKFYQVQTESAGSHGGSKWFTNKRDAKKYVKEWSGNYEQAGIIHPISEWNIEPTKKGILDALNSHASHPDNG